MIKFCDNQEGIKKFVNDLANLNDIISVHKRAKGYGYKYATLDSILEKIKPVLKENKMFYFQILEQKDN